MDAGPLNQRVTIQRKNQARTSTGGVTWTWVDVCTIWAAVEPLSGQEFYAAQQIQNKLSARIRIRHRDGLRTDMRVRHQCELGSPTVYRYYSIEAILPIKERRREIHLMCIQRESDGFRT